MRMWMIPVKKLCDKHLLGEHGELHKFMPSFRKMYSVDRRITPVVQIQLTSYKQRHDELAEEMVARGFNHASPIEEQDLPDFTYLPKWQYEAKVDINYNIQDLKVRCINCARRLAEGTHGIKT